MKTLVGLAMIITLIACGSEPNIDPTQCQSICAPHGICEYQGDTATNANFCICKDADGNCPNKDGGVQ